MLPIMDEINVTVNASLFYFIFIDIVYAAVFCFYSETLQYCTKNVKINCLYCSMSVHFRISICQLLSISILEDGGFSIQIFTLASKFKITTQQNRVEIFFIFLELCSSSCSSTVSKFNYRP